MGITVWAPTTATINASICSIVLPRIFYGLGL